MLEAIRSYQSCISTCPAAVSCLPLLHKTNPLTIPLMHAWPLFGDRGDGTLPRQVPPNRAENPGYRCSSPDAQHESLVSYSSCLQTCACRCMRRSRHWSSYVRLQQAAYWHCSKKRPSAARTSPWLMRACRECLPVCRRCLRVCVCKCTCICIMFFVLVNKCAIVCFFVLVYLYQNTCAHSYACIKRPRFYICAHVP
jgi:hypothetical protein